MTPQGPLWDEVLAQLPGEVAGTVRLGGTANSTWRVETRQGVFVVRLHDGWADPAGVDRRREAQLHAVAASAGLAPGIVAADPAGRFLITEFIDGRLWTASDMTRVESLRRVARQLRTLHTLPPPAVVGWDLGLLLASHAQRLAAAASDAEAQLAPLLERAHAILAQVAAAGRPPCIIHNDMNHTNLVGPEPVLLDFEYAAVADPLSDLASLLAYYPGAQPHLPLLLLESGLGRVPAAQLMDLAWVYILVSWLWYRRYELTGRMRDADREAMEALRRRGGLLPEN